MSAAADRGIACLAAGDWAGAQAALAAAVADGDDTGPTLLNLALAEDRVGADGRGRMTALEGRWPHWDEPPLRLAESYRRAAEPVPAADAYERALAINPNREEALLGLGALRITLAEPTRALPLLLRCCARAPQTAEAWDALGIALRAAGDAAAAEAAAAEAQRLRPADLGFARRRAEAALAAGTADAELARLTEAARRTPLDAALATARGVLLRGLGRAEEAVAALEVATALAPEAPEPAALLGEVLLLNTARTPAALPALRRAVALAPENALLRNNLAATLTRLNQNREAREHLDALIDQHGEHPAFLCNLANALVQLGHQHEAVATARRAVELAPEMHLAWRTLGVALAYAEGDAAELRAVSERAAAALPRRLPPPPPACGPERRLRLGLLSRKLKTHPVGWLTLAAFESLDPRAFEIVCLATAPGEDRLERRFRAVAADWVDAAALPAQRIAERARALGIDILIDLGGAGDDGLMAACAERAAPVQIKWVGSQAYTTGLPEMDHFLTDRWETPDGHQRFYTERLLHLPDGYVCYSPPVHAPEVVPLPAARRGRVTFGCFNHLAKITPAVIATWAAILQRVPDSRMVVKAAQFSEPGVSARIAAAFAAHGVDAARLDLRGASAHRAHLAQHADVDIVLDPFPYAGGLTTCEALWMGVPVVTLAGESFAARHSASHLHNCGLPEWVAAERAEYEEIAVARAADIAALGRLRAELRARVGASPLCDAPRFAANLGAALRGVWREACARP